jgi:phage tail-like protein
MTASSYLGYLPAVYTKDSPALLGDYLKIFEKLLTGLDDGSLDGRKGIQQLLAAGVVGELFYPRLGFLFKPSETAFIPPISGAPPDQRAAILALLGSYLGLDAPKSGLAQFLAAGTAGANDDAASEAWLSQFLGWLAGWAGLALEHAWDIDKQRTVIAEILALYRVRGTPAGMGMLLALVLDLPLAMTGADQASGELAVTVANPALPGIVIADSPAASFRLHQRYHTGEPVVSGFAPWYFEAQVALPNDGQADYILTADNVAQVQALVGRLRQWLDRFTPAGCRYAIRLQPSMQLTAQGNAAQLGKNTLLGG